MKVVLQRVQNASVAVDGDTVGRIGRGLLVFVCAEKGDSEDDVAFYARKVANMRIFPDEAGKTNLSVMDIQGAALVVSQFTLAADWRKGNRPGFSNSEDPARAEQLYNQFCDDIEKHGVPVQTGQFAADMKVTLLNDGPFTIVMD